MIPVLSYKAATSFSEDRMFYKQKFFVFLLIPCLILVYGFIGLSDLNRPGGWFFRRPEFFHKIDQSRDGGAVKYLNNGNVHFQSLTKVIQILQRRKGFSGTGIHG